MTKYRFFLRDEESFGPARAVWLVDDSAAIAIGKRLLSSASGVDIWSDEARVALLFAGKQSSTAPAAKMTVSA